MYENLESFGEILMVDGKAIQSFGTKISKNTKSGGRGEHDANWCKKQYSASGANGESIIKTKKWFGFRLHLIADATYELLVAFSITKASNSEKTETQKLLDKMESDHNECLETCKYFLGDKGYDSSKIINWLEWKEISPIIDIRNCWKDGGESHQYRDYKFEHHTIRGLDKMTMFLTVTFLVYMTMAQAKIQAGETEHLRRLYA